METKIYTLEFDFVINIAEFQVDCLKSPYSSAKTCDLAHFALVIYPKGKSKQGDFSVFISCITKQYGINADIKVTLVTNDPARNFDQVRPFVFYPHTGERGWQKFLSTVDILSNDFDFIQNGHFIQLNCKVIYYTLPPSQLVYGITKSSNLFCYFQAKNKKLQLNVGNLIIRSEIMKQKFKDLKEETGNTIVTETAPVVSYIAINKFVKLCHGKRQNVGPYLCELFILASVLEMETLRIKLEERLALTISEDNLKEYRYVAKKYNGLDLLDRCEAFAEKLKEASRV